MNGRFENGAEVVFNTGSVTRGENVWVAGIYRGIGFRPANGGFEWYENIEVRPGVCHEVELGRCILREGFSGECITDFIM